MLKYYDRVCKMLKRVHLSKDFKEKVSKKEEEPKPAPEKFQSNFNRSDIQKFVTWCKYKQDRVFFSSVTQSVVPLTYDASYFYPIYHNFAMRLQINVERPRLSKSPYLPLKEEPSKRPQLSQPNYGLLRTRTLTCNL